MNDHEALELCKKFAGPMNRAGVLDTLDGGWLMIGFGPAEPTTKFDPAQLRNPAGQSDGGQWVRDPNFQDVNATSHSPGARKPVDFQKFFETYQPFVAPLAKELDTDPDFFLAIIAKEDKWGTDEHNIRLNNFFGVTYGGGPNVGYDNPDSARRYWIKRFGDAVYGARDIDAFIAGIKSKGYNADAQYYIDLKDTYYSVLRHRLRLGLAQ